MDYLDFVEEHNDKHGLSLFEKVLVATTRAKDLYGGRTSGIEHSGRHKPTAIALYELSHDVITPTKAEVAEDEPDEDFGEEEEEKEDAS